MELTHLATPKATSKLLSRHSWKDRGKRRNDPAGVLLYLMPNAATLFQQVGRLCETRVLHDKAIEIHFGFERLLMTTAPINPDVDLPVSI
jgi:hypothetical protein